MTLDSSILLDHPPQSGQRAAWLGGDDTEIACIQQQVAVPPLAGSSTRSIRRALPGRSLPLQVRVETDDSVESSLLIDNFFFTFEPTGDALFRDGFESGDTAFWVVVD